MTGKSCRGPTPLPAAWPGRRLARSVIPSSASGRDGGVDLGQSAVDDDEVGRIGELARLAGVGVDARGGRHTVMVSVGRPPRHQLVNGLGGEQPGEPAGEHLAHRGGVVDGPGRIRPAERHPLADRRPRMMKRRYSEVRASPSSKTTIEATTLVPWTCETSKHSIRNGASARPERLLQLLQGHAARGEVPGAGELVPRQRLQRRCFDRLHQRALVAPLRHPQVDR
jgi:hypothetical protein